jgi:hemerythrin-like domain-containing protein
MRITDALLGEHGAIYPLLDLLEKTLPDGDLAGAVTRAACLHSALITHAAIEDAVLRPAIQKFLPPPPSQTDHEVIEQALLRVMSATDRDEAMRLLRDALARTRKHFHKEETVIFPLAERELSADELDRLGDEWAARRRVNLSR